MKFRTPPQHTTPHDATILMMETVFCECKKCNAQIGRFANLWTQIGKSYFSPVVEPEDDLAVQCQGAVRVGERGTLVEECHLQDVVCCGCAALLGLRCTQTPVNHVLDTNQILLRLASVELLGDDGGEIEFAVKRVLNVNEPSKLGKAKASDSTQGAPFASAFPGAVELQQLQLDLHAQTEDIRRIDSNGFRIVTALDKRTSRLGDEVTRLRATVSSVHRDVGGLQQELGRIKPEIKKVGAPAQDPSPLSRLENQLVSITSALGEVGQQLNTVDSQFHKQLGELKSEISQQQQDIEDLKSIVRTSVSASDYAQDMAALRAEMAQLRRQTEETRAQGTERIESAFPSRELEVLTTNIAKISNRASQVETLQMELEILKGRVERTEANRARTADNRQLTRTADAGPPMYSDNVRGGLKRAASPSLGPVPKRSVSTVNHPDFPGARYTTPPAWSAHQSPAASREDAAGHEDSSRAAGSATGANKPRRGRPASSSTRTSTRLRKR